jgi:hypothetical protein
MNTNKKLKERMRDPKVHLALGLVVTAIGFLAPKEAQSYCQRGNAGDCVTLTSGNNACSQGSFFNDCK